MITSYFLFISFVLFSPLAFSQSFSYDRQLSYRQCDQCGCKKSLSFEIVSEDLTSSQQHCADINNRQDLIYRDLTKGGTTGGLLGGPQEGCADDCDHNFEMTTEDTETITLENCD